MKKINFLLIYLIGCSICVFSQETKQVIINDTLEVKATLLESENFESDLSDWVIEKVAGSVSILDEKLDVDVSAGCTVWNKTFLDGPTMIEYDAVMVGNGGDNDRVSDLNCFWMAKDPANPNDFFQNSIGRGGDFTNYHPLSLYYVGQGANNNSTTRFRRYKGTGERPVLPEHDLRDSEFLVTANAVNHIKIIAYGNIIQYYRNDQLIYDFDDSDPYTSGYFGIRTVRNHLTVDNFQIFSLENESVCSKTTALIEAECYDDSLGIQVVDRSVIGYVENGDWASYDGLDLTDMNSVEITYASHTLGGSVEFRLDAVDGNVIGEMELAGTGSWDTWETESVNIERVEGSHDLYLVFTGGDSYLFDLDNFGFSEDVYCNNVVEYIEAECYDDMFEIQSENCSEGTENIGWIQDGDWTMYSDVDLTNMQSIKARVSGNTTGSMIEVRLDGENGELIGEIPVTNTGGNQNWVTDSVNIISTTGLQDVCLVFKGGEGYLYNINHFGFSQELIVVTGVNSTLENELSIYPNPSNGLFKFDVIDESEVIIFNRFGEVQYQGNISTNQNLLDLSHLASGVYQAHVKNSQSISVLALIKN